MKRSLRKGSTQMRWSDDAPVMNVNEACDYLRIHRSTLYRMIKRGGFPHFRIGASYRFNREALDK